MTFKRDGVLSCFEILLDALKSQRALPGDCLVVQQALHEMVHCRSTQLEDEP